MFVDSCGVSPSLYPHKLKNMPDHGGNQTYMTFALPTELCSRCVMFQNLTYTFLDINLVLIVIVIFIVSWYQWRI